MHKERFRKIRRCTRQTPQDRYHVFSTITFGLLLATHLPFSLSANPGPAFFFDGPGSAAYTCTLGSGTVNFTAVDDQDPVVPGGAVTYTFDIELPEIPSPIFIDINSGSLTFPIPSELDLTGATLSGGNVVADPVNGTIDNPNDLYTISFDLDATGQDYNTDNLGDLEVPTITLNATVDAGTPDGTVIEWLLSVVTVVGAGGSITITCNPDDPTQVSVSTTVDTDLPVELVAFNAVAASDEVLLNWETRTETNNAGFEIQQRAITHGEAWTTIGYVEGAGTTLEPRAYQYRLAGAAPGRQHFRLKQVDFDGAVTFSPTVEVLVEMADSYRLSEAYPNPFNPSTQLSFTPNETQQVRAEVYDASGRLVETLFDGEVQAYETRAFRFDSGVAASGVYLIRVAGRGFSATRQVVLMK